jgi:dephospho-CoA kinase
MSPASQDLVPAGPVRRAPVLRVGLTGGIATGKSTVAGHFSAWGAVVIDADVLARQLVEPGAAGHAPVVREYGPGVVAPDGTIDRAALGRIVFADPRRRAVLEGILHPLIFAAERALIDHLEASGRGGIAVVNAALLVEAGTWRTYDRVVVVHCAEAVQVARIVARDGLARDQALARVRAQMPAAEKLKVAHYAIDTGDGFEATETRAREVWERLQEDQAALAGGPGSGSGG